MRNDGRARAGTPLVAELAGTVLDGHPDKGDVREALSRHDVHMDMSVLSDRLRYLLALDGHGR